MSKRTRKVPEKFSYNEEKEDKAAVTEGSGTPLGDIKAVGEALSNSKKFVDAVEALHWLVFKSKGKQGQQRKNLRGFKGIVYGPGKKVDVERQRYVDRAAKYALAVVKEVAEVLGLEKKGSKEDMCGRIVDFLENPSADHKPKPAAKAPAKKKKNDAPKDLTAALMAAVAKYQLKIDGEEASLKTVVKNAEDFVGIKLPKEFKTVVTDVLAGDDDEDDEEDEEDDAPKAKKAKKSDDDGDDEEDAADEGEDKADAEMKDADKGEEADDAADEAPAEETKEAQED